MKFHCFNLKNITNLNISWHLVIVLKLPTFASDHFNHSIVVITMPNKLAGINTSVKVANKTVSIMCAVLVWTTRRNFHHPLFPILSHNMVDGMPSIEHLSYRSLYRTYAVQQNFSEHLHHLTLPEDQMCLQK